MSIKDVAKFRTWVGVRDPASGAVKYIMSFDWHYKATVTLARPQAGGGASAQVTRDVDYSLSKTPAGDAGSLPVTTGKSANQRAMEWFDKHFERDFDKSKSEFR